MSSTELVDCLRQRNKELLRRLEQQREELERVSGCSRKRDREDEAEDRRQAGDTGPVPDGGRGPARAALTRLTVTFAEPLPDTRERQSDVKHSLVPAPSQTAPCADSSNVLDDSEHYLPIQDRLQDTSSHIAKTCLLKSHEEEKGKEQSRVTFESEECVETPAPDRRHLQPLLGYDWIAGVLDAEDTFVERSDEFFNDLRNFRSLHKDECVHSPQAVELSVENHSGLTLLADKDETEAKPDTHKCTFSYRINKRLFPVPLHHQEQCPVCRKPKSSHPHTSADPALIRVSIPRSTLLPPYKYKAHRRCSFDSSDSLGLPSHCLSGWSHTGQSAAPPPSSLDLRSSLNTKNSEHENLSAPVNQMSNVTKLTRHNFQHFSKNIASTSYPGC